MEQLVIEEKKIEKYSAEIMNFYNRYFPEESNKIMIENTTVFFLAKDGEEIVGAARMLTDKTRYGLLLDLIVRKNNRGQGIGKEIVENILNYSRVKKIKKIILTTDPKTNWLADFYEKMGFKKIIDQNLMEYQKNN